MRPRVFPAEDHVAGHDVVLGYRASMRPRVFPAEDKHHMNSAHTSYVGFNEAAGIPRGRPEIQRQTPLGERPASMRPRVFPAEDAVLDYGSTTGDTKLQ